MLLFCSRGISGGNAVRDFPLPEAANEQSTNMGIDDPLRALSRYVACLIHPKVIPSIADTSQLSKL